MRPINGEKIAQQLHVTPRTLRRKLREQKTSLRGLLDELRMNLALKYLRDTDLATKGIAHALGYSETTSFRRALRRWTRSAPTDVRKQVIKPRPSGPSQQLTAR
jgi:AraC-like DNA-binding protein